MRPTQPPPRLPLQLLPLTPNRRQTRPLRRPSPPSNSLASSQFRHPVPTEDAFNRGQIIAEDETAIDAVLLGRVTSLVKKYLDMDTSHVWVVYPRTNPEADNALNVQIVGVWEPETLMGNKNEEDSEDAPAESDSATAATESPAADPADADTAAASADNPEPASAEPAAAETPSDLAPVDYVPADEIEADVFSIRGEVARYYDEKGEILISILQKVRSGNRQQRTFKLAINGKISEKTIGYFWEFEVRREGLSLVVHGGSCIAPVPPKKKKKKFGGKKRFTKGGPRKFQGHRDKYGEGDAPKPRPVPAATSSVEKPASEKPAPEKPSVNLSAE